MPGDSEQQVTIKTEIGSAFKRLPSFRTPRDLKLTEFRDIRPNLLNENRTKRVFIPNLNVQRKSKVSADADKEVPTATNSNDLSKQSSKDRGRRDIRGRGRGKKQANFIQSTGIFSEGLAPTLKHWNSSKSYDSTASSSTLSKPKLNLKEHTKVNKEEEEEVIKELLKDDFIDDPDNLPDLQQCPVKLPLQDCKNISFKCELDGYLAKEESLESKPNGIIVKKEPSENENINGELESSSEEFKPISLKQMRPWTIPQLLSKSSDKNFLFFQIPNCLPNMKVNMQSGGQNSKKDNKKVEETANEKCVLRSLPPGLIGKLQILKSGRARLILGDVKLLVEPGTQTAFKQDLISVNLDSEKNTGTMLNIGDITTRMLITPDWDSLLSSRLRTV